MLDSITRAPKMSDCASTQTANSTSACLSGNASEQPAAEQRYDKSHVVGECYEPDPDDNDQEAHPFGECCDETCCDPATLYHCEDEISYYRDKGMFFLDRGDGTGGDWCNIGGSAVMGKGTGVVFED